LASSASRAGGWVAELVDRRNVRAIEEVEGIGDQVELKAFTEGQPPCYPHIPLEKVGGREAVPAQVAVAALKGRNAGKALSLIHI